MSHQEIRPDSLYFAYGSNLLPRRLEERVGPFAVIGMGICAGYSLAFHKVGKDGSGKGDMCRDQPDSPPVYGAIYRLSAQQRKQLDGFEGAGYAAVDVALQGPSGPLTAYTYIARPGHINASLQPFRWYRDLVSHGAREHALPAWYVAMIERVPVIDDPDQDRTEIVSALLRG